MVPVVTDRSGLRILGSKPAETGVGDAIGYTWATNCTSHSPSLQWAQQDSSLQPWDYEAHLPES
jgi:hypothetical protein